MNLFIRMKEGVPFEHPITEENFREAFPNIDIDNLPEEFKRFKRIPQPQNIGVYEVNDGLTYEVDGDVVSDVWHVRNMTQEEISNLQNAVKTAWLKEGFSSWIFNDLTCNFEPPISYPTDGNLYTWDEKIVNWVVVARLTTTESGTAPNVIE